jgi:hypothetical protein
MVRKRGFEPPRGCPRQPLKLVRPPFPPKPKAEFDSRGPPSYLHGHFALSRASSCHSGGKGGHGRTTPDPRHGSVRLLGRPRHPLLTQRQSPPDERNPRDPVVGRRSARPDHAAASTDGHVAHDADRLASLRIRRAAAARVVRSVGTASPVPKYISSGVCPRNAECGSTRLCSST